MLHGRNRPFPRSRGAPGNAPTQAETTSWQAAVVTNAGTVSAGRFTVVNNFIAAEKAAGTWALTDDYWGLWGENAPQALTSLKQLRLATVTAAPAFTADRGYTFDGTTQYVNTGFIPGTHAVAMTGTSLRVASYERTHVLTATVSIGGTTGGAQAIQLIPRGTPTSQSVRMNSNANVQFTALVDDTRGYSVGTLAGTLVSDMHAFKNGVELVRVVSAPTMGSVLPTFALYVGASNSAGSASGFRAAAMGFACVGAALTAAQEQAQYNNVQAWATAIGAQV